MVKTCLNGHYKTVAGIPLLFVILCENLFYIMILAELTMLYLATINNTLFRYVDKFLKQKNFFL